MKNSLQRSLRVPVLFALTLWIASTCRLPAQEVKPEQEKETITAAELKLVEAVEQARIKVVNKVIGSVVAIYGDDKQGGGSGVIFDKSGLALTNHHVIMGAGVNGWGGLADGKLYRWHLVGTDPGGDVAIIQMEGKDEFPYSELGDSDKVRVGDWAFAMGNPFTLSEDQAPTVTLGIVSGIERFQGGTGRTGNQLVYGNCIQMDSSINPGNSGGPLFNMDGEIIGINGRGSFQARGRVNVGLGYAISSNQIKNFIPDLLATKLTEHGTLDAHFSERDGGKVVCSTLDLDSPVAKLGLELGDELLEFEGNPIQSSNHFKNLICTLPEDWPAELLIRKEDKSERRIFVRLYGLPYAKPPARPAAPPKKGKDGKEPTPEQKRRMQKQKEMRKLLSAKAGTVRDKKMNQKYANHVIRAWDRSTIKYFGDPSPPTPQPLLKLIESIYDKDQKKIGSQTMWLCKDGRFRVEHVIGEEKKTYLFDGKKHWSIRADGTAKALSPTQAKLNSVIAQAVVLLANNQDKPFSQFGEIMLDGTGKAQKQLAYRFKVVDAKDDWYYFWLSMYDENGKQNIELLKASSEKDADENSGAWSLEQWRNTEQWLIAHRRSMVDHLPEKLRYQVRTEKSESTSDISEKLFTAPTASDEK